MFLVVCYDIPDNKRRTRVGKTLEGYGYRVQKSVFECELTGALLKKMMEEIKAIVHHKEDSVRYYSLCERCLPKVRIVGLGEVNRDNSFFVV